MYAEQVMAHPTDERGHLLRWLHRDRGAPAGGTDPGEYDADAVAQIVRFAGRFFGSGRYFDLDVRGMEHVPASPARMSRTIGCGPSIPRTSGASAYA